MTDRSDPPGDPGRPDLRGVHRRGLLAAGGLVAGGLAAGELLGGTPAEGAPGGERVRTVRRAEATRGGWYTPNRAPLLPTAFHRLPPGSVTPGGWIAGQLNLQLGGLNGHLAEISDYLDYDTCGWVRPEQVGWEELPYWLRGFSELGLVTGERRVRDLAGTWIDGIIATATADGWFGPAGLRTSLAGGPDFWPSMPLLDLLRTHQEATGDDRVVPLLTAFFGFMARQPDAVFGRSWASFRWGDDIDTIYWLYNRTGEAALLELVDRIHANSADYVNSVPTWHNVNLSQGFREPAQYWLRSADPGHRNATYRLHGAVWGRYGQFSGGGIAADENARSGFYDPRQGFETCGIVELMRSCELLTRITGDPVWTDRCEDLALNMLPAAYDPRQQGVHYITSANSVSLDNAGKHPQFDNSFAMQPFRPGVHIYRCCPHNYGQGWPYYSEEMWLATADGGLAASLYGPSSVTARVGAAGRSVTVTETTDYPFDETLTFTVRTATAQRFPLWLRIPGWCSSASVRIGGRPVGARPEAGGYLVIDRTWRDRDTVELRLPMPTSLHTWQHNADSVSVRRGPLAWSLAIGEQYRTFTGDSDSIDDPDWPQYEVHPTTDWNYGLVLDQGRLPVEVVRRPGPVPAQPFTAEAAPVTLRAPARQIPNWTVDDRNVVRHLQPSPVRSGEPVRRVTLLPMGAARLRITSFPTVTPGSGHEWERPSASHVWQDDLLDAANDGLEPESSYDQTMPRLTWWDHLGSSEWAQYDYADPITTGSASVYWYDDTGHGSCRVPASWQLLYRDGDEWVPVAAASGYSTDVDAWNTVTFAPVTTTAVRLSVQLSPGVSGGLLEWRVDQQ